MLTCFQGSVHFTPTTYGKMPLCSLKMMGCCECLHAFTSCLLFSSMVCFIVNNNRATVGPVGKGHHITGDYVVSRRVTSSNIYKPLTMDGNPSVKYIINSGEPPVLY